MIAKDVQWQYMPKNSDSWKNYNIFMNEKIEKAHQKKKDSITLEDESGEKCEILLGNALSEKDSKGFFKHIIRRVDLSATMMAFPIPKNWDQNKKCDLITLDANSEEYKAVSTKFTNSGMNGRFTAIVSIERVQHERLYFQYQVHKKAFKEQGKADERELWHGSLGDSIENIWTTGFNRSYCGRNATVYGKGVYFASTSVYSHSYTNFGSQRGQMGNHGKFLGQHGHMFLSKVLVGKYEVGSQATESKNLPRLIDGKVVDSTVDNKAAPTIFVIFHDAQAYPEYLITYQ
jgi:poly [ADP-ribose] polymerase 10/14/15